MIWVKRGAFALVVVLLLAVAALATWEPFFATAANPPPLRTYTAEIIRDDFGVPHIYGATDGDTAYGVAPYNANEVSGTGWASGGVALTSTAVDESPTGTLRWDAADVSETGTTLTNAMAGLIYADALAGNNAILLVDFVTAVSTVAGTLTITWAAGGIFTIDLTP